MNDKHFLALRGQPAGLRRLRAWLRVRTPSPSSRPAQTSQAHVSDTTQDPTNKGNVAVLSLTPF